MGSDIQIKLAYEQSGMTPAEIAEDQDLDEGAVKAKLMQVSTIYRKDCSLEPAEESKLNFTEEQHKRVMERIYEIAITSEEDSTALKAAMYIRDDKMGRKEVVKGVQNNQFNILNWNEMMQAARNGADRIKQTINNTNEKKLIEV